jgi:hypothetical protein
MSMPRHRRTAALLVGVVLIAVAAVDIAMARRNGPSPAAGERATVTIEAGSALPAATGVLISGDGLILTAAHAVAPQTPGVAVAVGRPSRLLRGDPPFLDVTTSSGARFRAHLAAVDGYLDLAVIRVDATDAGEPVDPAHLRLPFLRVAGPSSARVGEHVRVAAIDGRLLRISARGAVAAVTADPFHRVPDPGFDLETTVAAAGSEGGAAIDDAGRVVGVAEAVVPNRAGAVWRLRAVGIGTALLAAARGGQPYASPWIVPRSGNERVAGIGVGATVADACVPGADALATGPAQLTVGFAVSGVDKGESWAALVVAPDQTLVHNLFGAVPESTFPGGSGCLSTSLGSSLLGKPAWPDGTYSVQLAVGPDLDPVGPVDSFTVGPVD